MSNFFFSDNVFYSIRKLYPPFVNIFNIISLLAAELEEPTIGMWGKGLKGLGGLGISFQWNNLFPIF